MKLPDILMTRVLAITALVMCSQNSEAGHGIAKYIIGGSEAVKGLFPWMVQIKSEDNGWENSCGGSIISSRWILTAAHCYKEKLPTVVYCGSILEGGKNAELVVYQFDAFIKHEPYEPRGPDDFRTDLIHDIALIKLSVPLEWSANIKPVSLPRRSQQYLPDGTSIVTCGFGAISVGNKELNIDPLETSTLMYTILKVNNQKFCQRDFLLCSDYHTDRAIYDGDSGGPWVWVDPQREIRLVGVTVSSLIFEDYGDYLSISVSVAHFLDWIHHHTGILIED